MRSTLLLSLLCACGSHAVPSSTSGSSSGSGHTTSGGSATSGGNGGASSAGSSSGAGSSSDGGSSSGGTVNAPTITSTALAGSTSLQVRQGAGAISVIVTGTQLDNISVATIASLTGTVTATTDTQATITFTIPHGAPLGDQTLSLTAAAGTASFPAAVTITAISAAAGTGSDSAAGTTDAPFLTLTHALAASGAGDTVLLADGTYSVGETWPTGSPVPHTPNVPDQVTLQGTSIAGTVLEKSGNGTQVTGLAFAGAATVSSLSITGFRSAIVASVAAAVTISNVRLHDNTYEGLYVIGANVTAKGVECDNQSLGDGMYVEGGTLSVSQSDLHQNSAGISIYSGTVSFDSSRSHDNGTGAVISGGTFTSDQSSFGTSPSVTSDGGNGSSVSSSASGLVISNAAVVTLTATTISGNASAGIYSTATGALAVAGEVSNNGTASSCTSALCNGIVVLGSQTVTLSGTQVFGNANFGIYTYNSNQGIHPQIALSGVHFHDNVQNDVQLYDNDSGTAATGTTLAITDDSQFTGSAVSLSWSGNHVRSVTMDGGEVNGSSFALQADSPAVVTTGPVENDNTNLFHNVLVNSHAITPGTYGPGTSGHDWAITPGAQLVFSSN